MVSSSHEALHRIFQEDTALLLRAFQRLLDVPFPDPTEITVLNPDLTELSPIERRADALLRVDTRRESYVLVIEAQGKKDPDKPGSWAYYLAHAHTKFRCQPVLVVLCRDSATARWAAEPIELGLPGWPSLSVRPLVLGPDNVPMITDAEQASRDVPLAVFSAITHSKNRDAGAILEALAAALKTVDTDTAAIFAEFTEVALGDTQARDIWKALMSSVSYFFQSEAAQKVRAEGRAEGRTEGRAEGRADAILQCLRLRDIDVSDVVRERIASCTDLELLDVWLKRAFSVTRAEELFEES